MGKCLVTKLNVVVNNNSLLKLGECKALITNLPATSNCQFVYINDADIRVISGSAKINNNNSLHMNGDNILKNVEFSAQGDSYIGIGKYGLKQLYYQYPDDTSIRVDLSTIKFAPDLVIFSSYAIGDISNFSTCPNLELLVLAGGEFYGDIASLNKCTKLKTIKGYGNLMGDLSLAPPNLLYLLEGSYTWDNERSSSCTIFSTTNVVLDNYVDKALINLAKCQASENDEIKSIDFIGTRTSASDTAISTLQNKGYTVIVRPNLI